MDIIEIDGEPVAKRGKMSGSKRLFRCRRCFNTTLLPAGKRMGPCKCGGKNEEISTPLLQKGKMKRALSKPHITRNFVLKQLGKVDLDLKERDQA
jgi:nicotinate phosphoribosyltransferase